MAINIAKLPIIAKIRNFVFGNLGHFFETNSFFSRMDINSNIINLYVILCCHKSVFF